MRRFATRALALLTLGAVLGASTIPAFAGTTGGVSGHVVDSVSQSPIAGVTVSAVSATQSASATTDATGSFHFLSLVPDTYTLQFSKDGYDQLSQAGVSVFSDQQESVTISLVKTLKTIAKVTSRAAGSLVKSGTGSDVYSVNPTVANAATGLTGPGSLSNAYGAIASVPGVSIGPGESGWYQTVSIRGGDIDQVGYELDGIPVNRAYDNAPMTMLSSLGQQELQVYTGGVPSGSDAQGISGYINQVVRTGTYPGFGTLTGAIGGSPFYHNLSIEAGGSSPDRRFSYYVGLGGANQDYRYVDNNNGAGQTSWFFMPVNAVDNCSFSPGPAGIYVGGVGNCGGPATAPLFGAGNLYGIANTQQRDALFNFHFAIPKHNGLRDDLQLMYLNSEVFANYYSSQNDLGTVGGVSLANALGQTTWDDTAVYSGALMVAPDPTKVTPFYFPFSPTGRTNNWGPLGNAAVALPASLRDANENGVAVTKLQYTHTFSQNAFLRAYGYTLYSTWEIYGPNTAAQPFYGSELAEYNIFDHTFGGNIAFTDQINDKNLLNATLSYTGSNLQRYTIGFLRGTYNVANFVNPTTGNCYNPGFAGAGDPNAGQQVGCVWQEQNNVGSIGNVYTGSLALPNPPDGCATTPACAASSWTTTNNTFYTGSGQAINQVHPRNTGLSINDQWRPNDHWSIDLGVRLENYRFKLADTGANDPARQFWFNAYNNEYCTAGIGTAPVSRANSTTGQLGACPAGTTLLAGSANALVNVANPPDYSVSRVQPRLSFTYTFNPDTVIRASAGVYSRPPDSSWVQYNVVQKDLPVYLGNHFAAFGYTTPEHNIRPDTSYNYDFSFERHMKGTDISLKLTPFYRATRDQLQAFFIDPAGGLVSGTNVGNQVSDGVELAITKGDFNRNGFAGQLALTLTDSKIKYNNFPGQSINVIDQLNNYIKQYNGFTTSSPCYFYMPVGLNKQGDPSATCGIPGVGPNPYFGKPAQPLLDKNGRYTTYDVIPGPFAGLNGYANPVNISLLLNYKHDRWNITPNLTYQSGSYYGAPTAIAGYDPSTCGNVNNTAPVNQPPLLPNGNLNPAGCVGSVFVPNPYSGSFDNIGQYRQPWNLTAGLGLSYEVSPRIKAQLNISNLITVCGQRGYAWDNSHICTYGSLGASLLAPAGPTTMPGSFYPNMDANSSGSVANATPPVQMLYPYGVFINNTNTGFVGTTQPIQITGSIQIKL
jgi:hypothetical protein